MIMLDVFLHVSETRGNVSSIRLAMTKMRCTPNTSPQTERQALKPTCEVKTFSHMLTL